MEITGDQPDIISYDQDKDQYIFCDTSKESPIVRRSLCYDLEPWESRKANKPLGSVIGLSQEWGVELLTEEEYRRLQKLFNFDIKNSG